MFQDDGVQTARLSMMPPAPSPVSARCRKRPLTHSNFICNVFENAFRELNSEHFMYVDISLKPFQMQKICYFWTKNYLERFLMVVLVTAVWDKFK